MKAITCFFLLISGLTQAQSADTIHTFVDEPAAFSGGSSALSKWIMERATFPDSLFYKPDELPTSKMRFTFIIEKDGSISDVDVDFGGTPAQEAFIEQQFMTSPPWIPAKLKGVPVRSRYNLPVYLHFDF